MSPFASAKDAEMQLLDFPSFPLLSLWLQDCPIHVNSLPSIRTLGFHNCTLGHNSAKVVGKESFRYTPEAFRNGLKTSAFSLLLNAYGEIYILHFSFSAQTERSFCTWG